MVIRKIFGSTILKSRRAANTIGYSFQTDITAGSLILTMPKTVTKETTACNPPLDNKIAVETDN